MAQIRLGRFETSMTVRTLMCFCDATPVSLASRPVASRLPTANGSTASGLSCSASLPSKHQRRGERAACVRASGRAVKGFCRCAERKAADDGSIDRSGWIPRQCAGKRERCGEA